jgi:hypothetical protein
MSRILGLTVCPYRKKQKIGRNIEKRQMWENFAKIVQILCTRVCKWKMKPVENILEMEAGGIK